MEPNRCKSIGCWTQVVTLNFDLPHELDLGFSMSNRGLHEDFWQVVRRAISLADTEISMYIVI